MHHEYRMLRSKVREDRGRDAHVDGEPQGSTKPEKTVAPIPTSNTYCLKHKDLQISKDLKIVKACYSINI